MQEDWFEFRQALGLIATLICACWCARASAQLKLDLAPEYYYWEEDYNGSKLLDESGFRIGLELSYKPEREQGWLWAGRIKIYGGSVDYNAVSQSSSGEPAAIKSTTDYYGALLEGRYGYRWLLRPDYFLDGLAGVGVDAWLRRLQGPGGYDEFWLPLYFKAGFELGHRQTGWIGALGLKVPVYTSEFSKLDTSTLTLHPKTMVSAYAEAGYQFTTHFSATAFFDSYWFKESSVSQGFLQPESKTFSAGAKLGWTF